jgi:predicted outer membrane protein
MSVDKTSPKADFKAHSSAAAAAAPSSAAIEALDSLTPEPISCFTRFSCKTQLIFTTFFNQQLNMISDRQELLVLLEELKKPHPRIAALMRSDRERLAILHHVQQLEADLASLQHLEDELKRAIPDAIIMQALQIKTRLSLTQKKRQLHQFLAQSGSFDSVLVLERIGFDRLKVESLHLYYALAACINRLDGGIRMVELLERILSINASRLSIDQVQQLLAPLGLEGIYRITKKRSVTFREESYVVLVESRMEILMELIGRLKNPTLEDAPLLQEARDAVKKLFGIDEPVVNIEAFTAASQLSIAKYCLYSSSHRSEKGGRFLHHARESDLLSAVRDDELKPIYPAPWGRWDIFPHVKPLEMRLRSGGLKKIETALCPHHVPIVPARRMLKQLKKWLSCYF